MTADMHKPIPFRKRKQKPGESVRRAGRLLRAEEIAVNGEVLVLPACLPDAERSDAA